MTNGIDFEVGMFQELTRFVNSLLHGIHCMKAERNHQSASWFSLYKTQETK